MQIYVSKLARILKLNLKGARFRFFQGSHDSTTPEYLDQKLMRHSILRRVNY